MTNEAAIGYMILAARSLGLDQEMINGLEEEMAEMMDLKTEEEAKRTYRLG